MEIRVEISTLSIYLSFSNLWT